MSDHLGELARRYASRIENARDAALTGTPVIGIVGADLPRALVSAASALPLRLFGSDSPSHEADTLLGRGVDEGTRGLLTRILDGELDFLTGIVVTHDCQASINLFYALRELARSGRITVPVTLVDLVHLDRPPTFAFDSAQLVRAIRAIEGWTGKAITASELRRAMLEWGTVADDLELLQRFRRAPHPALTGLDALHAFGVASAADAADAHTLLTKVATELREVEAEVPAMRLFLTGSSPLGDSLYRRLEALPSGEGTVVIVGEDHDWGELSLSVRPKLLPEDATVDQLVGSLTRALLSAAPAAPTSGQRERGAATRQGILASGATALLSIVREHDEAAAWDFPHQAEAAGVASRMVDRQPLAPADDVLRAALSELVVTA
jgi:hypothetical protein